MNKIELCYIPSGPFWMGSADDDKLAFDNEKPLHPLDLPYGYWLARFPVMVAQFTTFVEKSGYFPRDDKPLRDLPNCPVVHVNLREVKAFCGWLTEQWRQQEIIPVNGYVTLPSEAEWEKGARGGLQVPVDPLIKSVREIKEWQPMIKLKDNDNPSRHYPWGDKPESRRANYDETGINRASMVGRFTDGVSPYGCEEMSGNVWEWTRSQYREYPYNPIDGREDLNISERGLEWVLRGGGFDDFARSIRCATRFFLTEGGRSDFIGFRIVVQFQHTQSLQQL